MSSLPEPSTDPAPIFELFRGNFATEILTAAVAHFGVFGRLSQSSRTPEELGKDLGLQRRPALVLTTALQAMGLLEQDEKGRLKPTEMARNHLVPGSPLDVGDYVGLAATSPGVVAFVESLKSNRPAQHEGGAAFIYRDGVASAMEQEDSARHFTRALAGRAKNVAPVLARRYPLDGTRFLVDVAGGTGLYAIAFLLRNPELRAAVVDRPEVLKVAHEMAAAHGVGDRLELLPGDMFRDSFPPGADAFLLSNVLHDWDVAECRTLVGRCAQALPEGGKLLIHDVFLNDALDGPLPVALYSAALFTLTEGRAYSAAEYRAWLAENGLRPQPIVPTLVHCGVLAGVK